MGIDEGGGIDEVKAELERFPRYNEPLAPAKPFLMPSFNNEVVEILPSEKANKKIRFDENTYIQEIENRYGLMFAEDDDDDSYEIEIVEDDGDADFYLEIVDGEVFYVFETEDDASVDSEVDDLDEMGLGSDDEDDSNKKGTLQMTRGGGMDLSAIAAPNLDADDDDQGPPIKAIQVPDEKPSEPEPMHVDDDPVPAAADEKMSEPEQPKQQETAEAAAPAPAPATAESSEVERPSTPTQTGEATAEEPANVTPPTQPKPSVTDVVGGDSPGKSPKSPVRSILKACPPSPKKSPQTRRKRDKSAKREKKVTKTYVKAEHYADGEHRVYSWAKPDWTKGPQLKSTGVGDKIREGGNLAAPITFPKKLPANAHLVAEGEDVTPQKADQITTDELVRRIQDGTVQLPKAPFGRRKLKFSVNGAKMREGGDLSGPITKATVIRAPGTGINKLANKEALKRKGVQTQVNKKYEWQKPDWQKSQLKTTKRGSVLKEGADIAPTITHVPKKEDAGVNQAVQGLKLRPTRKGRLARTGSAPNCLDTENPDDPKKKYAWEKPEWTKKRLGKTAKSDAIKSGEKLERPITFPRGKGDDSSEDYIPEKVLRQSSEGDLTPKTEDTDVSSGPTRRLPSISRSKSNEEL